MDTLHGGHRSLVIITAYVLIGSASGHAQTSPPMMIAPAQQAERDGMRQRILEAELAAETAALADARNRSVERWRAGDRIGLAEAQAAIGIHSHSIAALRHELNLVLRSPLPILSLGPAREVRVLPAVMPRAPASGASVQPCGASETQPPRRHWDVFSSRDKSAAAACLPSEEDHRTRGVMWLRRDPPSPRHDPDASPHERSTMKGGTPSEQPHTPLLVYHESDLTPPPRSTSRDNASTIDRRPAPLPTDSSVVGRAIP